MAESPDNFYNSFKVPFANIINNELNLLSKSKYEKFFLNPIILSDYSLIK